MMSKKKKVSAGRDALFLDDEAAFHRKFGLGHDVMMHDWRVSTAEPSALLEELQTPAAIDRRYVSDRERQLQQEITTLRNEFDALRKAFEDEKRGTHAEKSAAVARLSETLEKLRQREAWSDILNRIHGDAAPVVLASKELQTLFRDGAAKQSFVMSVDIRRSTDLMLQARTPQRYAA